MINFNPENLLNMQKRLLLFYWVFCFGFMGMSQNTKKYIENALASKDSSVYYFKKAKKAIKTESDDLDYYFGKFYEAKNTDLQDSLMFYGNLVLKKSVSLKDKVKPQYVYYFRASSHQKNGKYELAIADLFKGLKLAQETKDEKWQGWFYQNLSLNYHDFAQYEKGVFYGKLAYKFLNKDKKDVFSTVLAINAIAINFDDWNKLDSALYYHKKIFDYKKQIDTLQIGFTYNNIGNTLLKQKKFKEALPWLKTALKISDKLETGELSEFYFYEKATNYTNLARVYLELNQFFEAQKQCNLAQPYVEKSKSIEKLRDFYEIQYLVHKKSNNFEKALEFKDKFYQIKDSIFKTENAKSIAEVETKFQVAQKEKKLIELESKAKERNLWMMFLIFIALAFASIGYLVFRQQKLKNKQQHQEYELKRAIAKIETQNQLQEQRLSISRDLHDNIGAQLTFIISSVDNLKFANAIADAKVNSQLTKISDFAKATIAELRDTIWAMNANSFTIEDLRNRIFNFIEKAKSAKEDISFKFYMDDQLKNLKLNSIVGINLYRTIQEAVNNALKYSDGTEISVGFFDTNSNFKVEIIDNGKGFDVDTIDEGNGLQNMRKRIEEVNGSIKISSNENQGTSVLILLPKTN